MTDGGVPPATLTALLALAREAADAGGAVLTRHATSLATGATLDIATKSTETDPVSLADRESEAAIVGLVGRHRPDDGILGEEGTANASRSGLRWVIDPLDGTVNYLYGHPGWCVSIAVEARTDAGGWAPVVAVVLDPARGHRYEAVTGRGATCDGRTLSVRDPVDLPMALVATGFAYDRVHRSHQAEIAARVIGHVRDIRRVGSAALDLCGVAAGTCDAYYEDSTKRWDWAAGALVAREAGAVVTPLAGPDGHEGVLAAGPALHGPLARLLTG